MSFGDYEYEQEVKRKKAAGWKYDNRGFLLPPQPRRERNRQGNKLDIPKTSDPDYYADSLLDEIKSVHTSVIDCYRDLKERLTVIENKMTPPRRGGSSPQGTKKRSVKHR